MLVLLLRVVYSLPRNMSAASFSSCPAVEIQAGKLPGAIGEFRETDKSARFRDVAISSYNKSLAIRCR